MTQHWKPSRLAMSLPRTQPWSLQLQGDVLVITIGDTTQRLQLGMDARVHVKPGMLWASVNVQRREGPPLLLEGLSNADAKALSNALTTHDDTQDRAARGPALQRILHTMRQWNGDAEDLLAQHRAQRR